MRVDKTQNASFGMALKIKPEAKAALTESSMETIKKLNKLGKSLKRDRHSDLLIGKDLQASVSDIAKSREHFAPFKAHKPYNSFFAFDSYVAGQPNIATYELVNQKAAEKAYSAMAKTNDPIEQATVLTKVIEEATELKAVRSAKEAADRAKMEKAANALLSKFGETKSHI